MSGMRCVTCGIVKSREHKSANTEASCVKVPSDLSVAAGGGMHVWEIVTLSH